MPIPYTREAIAELRLSARKGVPADHMRAMLGWDAALFNTICRRHQIDFAPLQEAIVEPPPQPTAADSGPFEIRLILSRLTPRQADIFRFLHPFTNGDHIRGAEIARRMGIASAQRVCDNIGGLRRRLDRMGSKYRVDVRVARDGGYRLVIDESIL